MEIQDTDLEEDDGADGLSQSDDSEERSRSPSHGSQQHYTNDTDQYEEGEYEGSADDEEHADEAEYEEEEEEEVEGSVAVDDDEVIGEAEEEYEEYEVEIEADAEVEDGNGDRSTNALTINGVGAKNRSVSAESLGSTVAAEYSPVSVQGSIDTLVEDTEGGKSSKESRPRRLRNRIR